VVPLSEDRTTSLNAGMSEPALVVLLAMTMSLTALGVDLLLPAFPALRAELGLDPSSTEISGFITAYFVGLAVGQITLGPLSDRYGRKPLLTVGIVIYIVGAVLSSLAPTLTLLLVARFIWGIGAAGGRVLSLAIVRDRFSGARMARMMSSIMAVFIIVPMIAPSIGAIALRFVTWHQLIAFNVVAALIILAALRQLGETLPIASRRGLGVGELRSAVSRLLRHPRSGPLVLAQAVLFGGFSSYLATSEIVYGEVFDRAESFPLLFGGMALIMGIAALINGRVVERYGLPAMLRATVGIYSASSVVLLGVVWSSGGLPPLWLYLIVLAVVLSSHAMTIPNMTSSVMEPMGDIAGIASAITGFVLVGGGALLGSVIDRAYDGTVLPLTFSFVVGALIVSVLVRSSERAVPADLRG
jgi:DHA1 family bicyclomycin/chloramphenicol resistance-like MFS transporter